MITTLTGENDVSRQDALQSIIDAFLVENDALSLERLDGEEVGYARMHEAMQSLPFLASHKLVVLRSPGQNKEFVEHFEQLTQDIPDTNTVVIVEPKLDKRLSYYKHLKKLTDFKDFTKLDANGLAAYLVEYARKVGGGISASDARFLIDRVGLNQLILMHEVDKLVAYNPKVSRASIELLTDRTPQSSVFELLDAAFAGNTKRTTQLYNEQRSMREEPQKIIGMLVWQLHILAIAKAGAGRSADAIAKDAGMSPYTVRKSLDLTRHISTSRLKQMITDLREFDVRLKSESLNADEVVRYYLLSLS